MQKLFTIIIQIIFTIVLGISIINQKATASSWPIFLPPDYQTLLKLNYIDTSQCPAGQGKLIAYPLINIREHLCKNFCPEEWQWVGHTDNQCHDLSNFMPKNVEILHYSDGNNTSYSVITVNYEKNQPNKNPVSFSMQTQPGEHWYCVIINQETRLLSCANDIKS